MTDTQTPRRTRTTRQLLAEITQPREVEVTDYTVFSAMHTENGDYGLGCAGSFETYEEAGDEAAKLRRASSDDVTFTAVIRTRQGGRVIALTPMP